MVGWDGMGIISHKDLGIRPVVRRGFPGGSVVKNLSANAGDVGSIPGSGGSPGEGNGNPLQYPCLENSMDLAGVQRFRYDLVTKQQATDYILFLLDG